MGHFTLIHHFTQLHCSRNGEPFIQLTMYFWRHLQINPLYYIFKAFKLTFQCRWHPAIVFFLYPIKKYLLEIDIISSLTSGLKINLNSSLTFRQVALKFCLPRAVACCFSLLFYYKLFSWRTTCLQPCPSRKRRQWTVTYPAEKCYLPWMTWRHFFQTLHLLLQLQWT